MQASWGYQTPMALHVFNFQYPCRLFQTRQQAQQSFFAWHSRRFSLAEFTPFSRSSLANSGNTLKLFEASAGGFVRNLFDPYHKIQERFSSFLEDEQEEEAAEEAPAAKTSGRGKEFLQYLSLAISTGAASVVIHPLTLMATWQIVQDKGSPRGFILSPSTWTASFREIKGTYVEITQAKKSLYDGLAATVTANIAFELLKFGISRKLHSLVDFQGRAAEIAELERKVSKEVDQATRENARKRSLVLRWRRITLSAFFNYTASILSELISYPLKTIALKLQAQNASFRFPVSYNGGLDCASRVIQEEGLGALYSGVTTLMVSFVPEVVMSGVTFVGVVLLIEVMSDDSRDLILDPVFNMLEQGLVK